MNRLKDKHKTVSSVNIITGMLLIIGVLFVILFEYITKPISMLAGYIISSTNTTKDNARLYTNVITIVSFGFILFWLVSVVYVVNNLFLWLLFLPVIYIVSITIISYIICIVYTEEYGNEVLTKYVEKPLIYLSSKTTSHCDLKK